MPVPSPIKIKRNGVEYVSNVDRAKYTLEELTRAALRDVGKLIRRRTMDLARKQVGMRRARRISKSFQFWVRRRESDLIVGIKHGTWYGVDQELGTKNQPKRAILRTVVMDNIDEIRKIQGMYLKHIENENRALGLISENDEGDNTDD
jgi:hypothetical protein